MIPAVLLAAAALVAPVQAPPRASSSLAADAETRWVPFDLTPGNQIRFPMTLDGHAVTAILDTGVSFSVLAKGSPALDPRRVSAGGNATGIGGAVAIEWMTTDRIALGGLTRTGGRVAVAALPAIATGSAKAVDLLVGRDLLGAYALDIDYAAHRFRLLPSGRLPFRGLTAPLAISAERRVYESEVTLGGRRLRPMIVDTGDGSALTLSEASWRAAGVRGVPTTTSILYGIAGAAVSELAVLPALSVGRLPARNVEVRIEPADGFSQKIGVAGRIGSGLLQNYRVLLDPAAGRMVLSPTATADRPPLRSTSGLLVGVATDRLRVLHVMRGGPAATGAWKAGDDICTVDGQPITPGYATSPLVTWSIGAPGRVVALGLCGGPVRPLTLARFY